MDILKIIGNVLGIGKDALNNRAKLKIKNLQKKKKI